MKPKLLYTHTFQQDDGEFVLEGKGSYEIADGQLILDDSQAQSGLTLWLKQTLSGPMKISYEAVVLEPELANNINLFFMAKTLQDEPVWREPHNGAYPDYHEDTKMYIFTMTGNMQGNDALTGWSRLRKNPGFQLLSENEALKTEFGTVYRYEITLKEGRMECRVDGELIHSIVDQEGYRDGAIGFRTWKTRLSIRNFVIHSLD